MGDSYVAPLTFMCKCLLDSALACRRHGASRKSSHHRRPTPLRRPTVGVTIGQRSVPIGCIAVSVICGISGGEQIYCKSSGQQTSFQLCKMHKSGKRNQFGPLRALIFCMGYRPSACRFFLSQFTTKHFSDWPLGDLQPPQTKAFTNDCRICYIITDSSWQA